MKVAVTLLALVCLGRADVQYRFGERSEVVSREPEEEINYARFRDATGSVFSKTYDQRLYQYPLEDIEREVTVPVPVTPQDILKTVRFNKEVSAIRNGLHREITYELSLEIAREKLNVGPSNPTCTLAIIDYCDYGFYIDFEEVDPTPTFRFFENERMDIEKMDSVVRQYSYALRFQLNRADFTAKDANTWQLNLSKTFQYHLRYGEANHAGRTLYKLARGFDVATDCWTSDHAATNIQNVRQIPRYNWALTTVFPQPSARLDFLVLNGHTNVQNFPLPVGNTNHVYWVQMSTKFLICYGITVLVFAMFWGPSKARAVPTKKL